MAYSDLVDEIKRMTERAIIEERKVSPERVSYMEQLLTDGGYERRNEKLFKTLCMLGASEIEQTTKKGLLLKGDVGIGKTLGLTCLAKVFRWQFFPATVIAGKYVALREDHQAWEKFCVNGASFYEEPQTMVIDDLGVEDLPLKVFGQDCYPLADMLEIRYRRAYIEEGKRTIVLTNLSDKELLDRYGTRIIDRLNEMCHVITVSGESNRK